MRKTYTKAEKETMAKQAVLAVLGLGFESPSFKNYIIAAHAVIYRSETTTNKDANYKRVERILKELKQGL